MTTRQELLDQWRSRLCEAEEACDDPLTDSWSSRLRRKLYRLLLIMYGQADWPGPKDDVDNEAGRRKNSELVVAEPQAELSGKEPRTRAQILKGLQNITGLSDDLAPPGPLGQGLHPNSPMVVASFKKRPRAESALWRLKRLGFAPEMIFRGNQYQIFVIASLATAAIRQLEDAKTTNSPPRDASIKIVKRGPRRNGWVLLGAMVFGLLGLVATGLAAVCSLQSAQQRAVESFFSNELQSSLRAYAVILNLFAIFFLWAWWRSQARTVTR